MMRDLDKATDPIQRAAWARENLREATRDLRAKLEAVAKLLDAADREEARAARVVEPNDPYEGMTNADVMSASEIAEYERDAEFAMDAADEERYAEENADRLYDDEQFDVDDDEQDDDEDGEL